MESFFDFYDLHTTSDDLSANYSKSQNNRKCRFCDKTPLDVSFNNKPHIIPELFGRNNITSNFECDECNKLFQNYETDTATMIQHYLALLRIKTKRGVPNFQSKKEQGNYATTIADGQINFGSNIEDYQFNDEEKTLTINFRTKRFCPFFVYKVFLKMGICLLSEDEIKENEHYFDFLNSEEPITNGLQVWTTYRYMLKTKYHLVPNINLYRAKKTIIKNDAFPEYILLINFSNIVFQFFLPLSKKNVTEYKSDLALRLHMYPSFVLDDITRLKQIEVHNMDLSEKNKVSITDKVVLHYQQRDRLV